MTTAHSDTITERTPGRAWTWRLIAHPGRQAAVTCSTERCRMPARSSDLPALRAFAARHAAAHANAATIRPHARCYCGTQRCGAHPDTKTHCAGSVVLILRHDPALRRVWSVEEVCEACAPLIPHATVLARAERPARTPDRTPAPDTPTPRTAPPGIASGFSAPPPSAGDSDPGPVRRPRRAGQRGRGRTGRQER
ncbi:hypothetical protein [Streptomyces sp. NBC_00470]|uniref:hypothetical protein n=1 Tax=Streptomyces sp. NBC_00470 TaxID=2975753 RepID=UPI002F90A2C2